MNEHTEQLKDIFQRAAEQIRHGFGGHSDFVAATVEVQITAEGDYDVSPGDYDCYSDEDKGRFARGDWEFICVTLTIQIDGIEFGSASLGAIDHGLVDEDKFEIDSLAGDILPSLFRQASEQLPASLRRIDGAAATARALADAI